MRQLILLFLLLTGPVFAGDDIIIQLYKLDASRHAIEKNHLQINEGSIYYTYGQEKGEVRTLLPGEFEIIISAMKSQLSYVTLDNKPKPQDVPFYHFSFEYDVGAKTVEFDVKGVTIDNELSSDMKAIIRKYFHLNLK